MIGMSNAPVEKEGQERLFHMVMISIIVVLAVMMTFIGGSLKWLLGLSIIFLMGVIILVEIYDSSNTISFWKRDNKLDSIVNLNLDRLSEIAERAYRSRTVSKALLEERIKEEFVKKLKNYKNLTDEETEKLLNNPKELREVVDDDVITNFIIGSKSYSKVVHEEPKSKKTFLQKIGFKNISVDKDYKERINEVLERMEEWN